MDIEKIISVIREYQYEQECIMDYSASITKRSYMRASIKYDAAEEIRGLLLRRYYENEDNVC